MIRTFHELKIGSVLVAPFVTYAFLAFVILMVVRPLLQLVAYERAFSNPPLAVISLYVVILAGLIVFF